MHEYRVEDAYRMAWQLATNEQIFLETAVDELASRYRHWKAFSDLQAIIRHEEIE